jgi:hypothetical protein
MEIEKFISPFIEGQFPLFYQEEGPLFIDFVKAYYEWMETQGNIIYQSRSLLDYRDLDNTLLEYVKYFKDKYINSLPENIIADKKLLIKHILELYRSKGTDNSYKLLFRMIFNEDIEIYLPGKNIFKTSDGEWDVPYYIEVSDNPYLSKMIGKEIISSSTQSSAVVENYFTKNVNKKVINVLSLNAINGRFKYGEKVLCPSLSEITVDTAPIIFGSLSSISITNGGINYNVGDILNVTNNGIGGLARVKSVRSKNGQVSFILVDGGSGFSANAVINVDGRSVSILNATNATPVVITTTANHDLKSGDTLRIDFVEGMTQLNINTYSYYANVINSSAFGLYSNPTLTTPINGTSYSSYVANSGYIFINTGGSGASFEIGSLVNKEIFNINTDTINDYFNAVLDSTVSGYRLNVNTINGVFSIGNQVKMNDVTVREFDININTPSILLVGESLSNSSLGITNTTVCVSDESYLVLKGNDVNNSNLNVGTILHSNTSNTTLTLNSLFPSYTINCTANVVAVNSSTITVNNQSSYFVYGEKLLNVSVTANAIISGVIRLTNWGFPAVNIPNIENLDANIDTSLVDVELEVGTIASLKNINPGEGYAIDPIVSIIEPLVYEFKILENGHYKGFNSIVDTNAGYANGIVTAVEIIDSGFGYDKNQDVNLTLSNNQYSVSGITVVDLNGIGKGYWKDNKSFISDLMYLQDSDYFQNYSYEILASRMLNTYENYIRDLVHPAGMKLFGRYIINSELNSETSIVIETSINYSSLTSSISITSDSSIFYSDSNRTTSDNFEILFVTSDYSTVFSDTAGITSDQINLS